MPSLSQKKSLAWGFLLMVGIFSLQKKGKMTNQSFWIHFVWDCSFSKLPFPGVFIPQGGGTVIRSWRGHSKTLDERDLQG